MRAGPRCIRPAAAAPRTHLASPFLLSLHRETSPPLCAQKKWWCSGFPSVGAAPPAKPGSRGALGELGAQSGKRGSGLRGVLHPHPTPPHTPPPPPAPSGCDLGGGQGRGNLREGGGATPLRSLPLRCHFPLACHHWGKGGGGGGEAKKGKSKCPRSAWGEVDNREGPESATGCPGLCSRTPVAVRGSPGKCGRSHHAAAQRPARARVHHT